MVDVERLKTTLRIEHDIDDEYLALLEAAAAEYVSALAEYDEDSTPSEMAIKAVEFIVANWYINRLPVTEAGASAVPDTLTPLLWMVSKAVC